MLLFRSLWIWRQCVYNFEILKICEKFVNFVEIWDRMSKMSASSGFGLEEIGIPGRDYLREALTSCTDPLKAIEDFQVRFLTFTNSMKLSLAFLTLCNRGFVHIDIHSVPVKRTVW